MATKSELKIAEQILDRFYRDAEGKTNRQVDVYYALEDMGIPRDKADPAITYLVSRGLVNTFGPDIAFLTDRGAQVVIEEIDISSLDKVLKDFIQKPVPEAPPAPAPAAEPRAEKVATARPKVASLTHIDLDGQEYTLTLGWVCTIGRADSNHVRVNDQRASKKHAEIRFEDGGFVLHDLESANGTLLNGQYVVEAEPMKHDDEIVIGRTMLLYTAPEKVSAPPAEEPDDAPAEEPATVVPMAPTERPAEAEVEPAAIRVVKGTPAPVAPSVRSDLFSEPAREASGADLFGEAPAAEEARPAPRPPSDDLFEKGGPAESTGDDLFGEASSPGASSDDLFGEPSRPGTSSEDLFGEASKPGADDDLFGEPSRPGAVTPPPKSDLFGDEPPTEAGTGSDLFDRTPTQTGRLEPPTVTPEVQSVPRVPVVPIADMSDIPSAPAGTLEPIPDEVPVAPESTEDWDEDTPQSSGPSPQQLLENQPVRAAQKEDAANTVMMTRDAIFGADEAEPPHWGDDRPPMGSHPAFSDAAEALPVATASLASAEVPEATEDIADTMDAELSADHAFHTILKALRAQTERADLPDRDAVLQAIDLLYGHPYVRVVLQKIPD